MVHKIEAVMASLEEVTSAVPNCNSCAAPARHCQNPGSLHRMPLQILHAPHASLACGLPRTGVLKPGHED